jgi:hypothetical protein
MAVLLPATVTGQPRFHIRGVLEVDERYDDNLFSSAHDRKGDLISRVSPRLAAGYHAGSFRVRARYARDVEKFHRHHELDSARAGQDASLDVIWPLGRALSAASSVSYADTKTAHDLNLITGLEIGRFPARRYAAAQSLALRMGAIRRLVADATFERQQSYNGSSMEVQGATLGYEQRLGPTATWGMGFSTKRFVGGGGDMSSHILSLAWSRDVTPLERFEIRAGPRLSTGHRIGPELSVGFRHQSKRGDLTLAYVQTESAVVGLAGPITTDGITGRFSHDLSRSLRIRGGPSVRTSRQAGLEGMVYQWNVSMVWRVARHLVVTGSHMLTVQQGDLGGNKDGDLFHNTFILRLSAPSADN